MNSKNVCRKFVLLFNTLVIKHSNHMKEIKRIMMMLVIAVMASSTMMADDLTFFELKGPVKTVVIKDNNFLSWPMLSISLDSYSLTFTKEGKLVTPDGNQITRNKNIKVIKYYT